MNWLDPELHPTLFNLYHLAWTLAIAATIYLLGLYSIPLLLILAVISSTQ